jgi:site-specific recombinase XerD
VLALLDGIVERGSPIQANRVLALVRVMFNWAISRDILEHNPCYQVKAPSKENQRDRVLTEEEIRFAIWAEITDSSMEGCTLIGKCRASIA